MINTIIVSITILAGLFLCLVGLYNGWPRHIMFGAIGLVAGVILLRFATEKKKWRHDRTTRRRYKYLNRTSTCPFCKQPCVMMISPEEFLGLWCKIHGFVWADIFAQYERWKAQEEEK